MSPWIKHLRLLPAVIVLSAGLIALKGVNLIEQARAGVAAPAPPAPSAAATPNAKSDGSNALLDDNTDSASEIDVLTSLAKRRKEIDEEARGLSMRANLLAAAEKRVDAKIADLKSLQAQIQALLGQRDAAQTKQLAELIKVYAAMKPRDAGRIFNSLDDSVLLEVAGGMKPDALAPILSAMAPEKAQSLTVQLANRLNLPKAAVLAPPPPAVQPTAASPAAVPAPGNAVSSAPPQTAAASPGTATPAPPAATK